MTKEKLRKFELVFIVDANLAGDQKEEVLNQVTDSVKKHGGNVINSQVWLEKQKFTFPMKKLKEGSYYLVNFESDGSGNVKIKSDLRINEKVLRISIVQCD